METWHIPILFISFWTASWPLCPRNPEDRKLMGHVRFWSILNRLVFSPFERNPCGQTPPSERHRITVLYHKTHKTPTKIYKTVWNPYQHMKRTSYWDHLNSSEPHLPAMRNTSFHRPPLVWKARRWFFRWTQASIWKLKKVQMNKQKH